MAQVTCSRCFNVFEIASSRPGEAPLCPACAGRAAPRILAPPSAGAPAAAPHRPAPARRGRKARLALRGLAVAGAAVLLAGAAAAVVVALGRSRLGSAAPERPARSPVEDAVAEWRDAGLVPPAAAAPADAAGRVAAGRAALAADLPARTAEALGTFRGAIAAAPERLDALSGYAEAVAELADEDSDTVELRTAYRLMEDATKRGGERGDVLAAYARVLLAVPGESNLARARDASRRARAAAPADPAASLASGLVTLRSDPAAAAAELAEAWAARRADRRLLSAAARARWAVGDASGALALVRERLYLDPAHPGALALQAEIMGASGKSEAARDALARWEKAAPRDPLPPFLRARIAYQLDGDLDGARRGLAEALARSPGDSLAARILAHQAAVERAAHDGAAAARAASSALVRSPSSAPARFQAALLAFEAEDARGLVESAGVLGEKGGPRISRLLAARAAELSGTVEEAESAWKAAVADSDRDPASLLVAAGALARLGAPGPALALARRALARDPLEGRLVRAPSDYWEGPRALADAAARLEGLGRVERAGGTAFAAAAACQIMLGRPEETERLARAAALASGGRELPLLYLAQAALDRGDARRAVRFAEAALEEGPRHALALEQRARVHEAQGRRVDAERSHRAALEAAPDMVTARLGLARLLARRGAADEARSLLEGLLAEDPALAPARGALLDLASASAPPRAAAR